MLPMTEGGILRANKRNFLVAKNAKRRFFADAASRMCVSFGYYLRMRAILLGRETSHFTYAYSGICKKLIGAENFSSSSFSRACSGWKSPFYLLPDFVLPKSFS